MPIPPLRHLVLSVPLLLGGIAPTPSHASPDSLYHEVRAAMGTTVEIYLYAATRGRAAELFEEAFLEIERVEEALSTYRATSEITRINTTAGYGPVVTDPEMFGLLKRALEYSRRTGGAFDMTVGPLVRAWGFVRSGGRYPPPAELAQARAVVGSQRVALDAANRSVRFLAPGIELDPGGIGKGYALDRAAHVLERHGVTAALLGMGRSSYYAIGAPPDAEGWRIVVPDPREPDLVLSTVWLRDRALSTSGNAQKFFELDGRRYSHIIDPRTGEPATGVLQVTVTARAAERSDALSTALFVVGPDRATRVVQQYPEVAALLVTDDHRRNPVPVGWGEPLAPGHR